MAEPPLDPDRILDVCEALIRRHGPAKANVLDVARALGMSHGNVYRHFASKAALREAVVARWLAGVMQPLAPILADAAPAPARLRRYIQTLAATKRARLGSDPELFAAYHTLAEEQRDAVAAHVAHLQADVATILAQGHAEGAWRVADPRDTAALLLEATLRFHHPHHVASSPPDADARLDALLDLLITGLGAA